jgi:hypothetical protein
VQLVVGLGVRVLHGHRRVELHVLAQRLPERWVFGQSRGVRRRRVQIDEPLPLPQALDHAAAYMLDLEVACSAALIARLRRPDELPGRGPFLAYSVPPPVEPAASVLHSCRHVRYPP